MRVLVFGAGVIGSVYAANLMQAGHEVVLLARGSRLADVQASGLILEEAESGQRMVLPVTAVASLDPADRYDLVLVAVRADQLTDVLPVLTGMRDGSPVLVFGNTAGRQRQLIGALGDRALFGFPAVGGVRNGPVIRYVRIAQQQTMLGEPTGETTRRVQALQAALQGAGFPTTVTANMSGWLLGHAAFVVPIAYALYRTGTDGSALASDPQALRLMVRATRQAFRALTAHGEVELPTNLRMLYLRLPTAFAVRYWRGVFAGPRGELWFGAHTRAAPEEMQSLADELLAAVLRTGRSTPDLTMLLTGGPPSPVGA